MRQRKTTRKYLDNETEEDNEKIFGQ
jgi:hypothetical protein